MNYFIKINYVHYRKSNWYLTLPLLKICFLQRHFYVHGYFSCPLASLFRNSSVAGNRPLAKNLPSLAIALFSSTVVYLTSSQFCGLASFTLHKLPLSTYSGNSFHSELRIISMMDYAFRTPNNWALAFLQNRWSVSLMTLVVRAKIRPQVFDALTGVCI